MLMEKRKGTGMTEMSSSYSFYGRCTEIDSITGATSSTQGWFITVDDATNNKQTQGRAWNSDYTLIGHAYSMFVMRGGAYWDYNDAGVLCTYVHSGSTGYYYGFRPVLSF